MTNMRIERLRSMLKAQVVLDAEFDIEGLNVFAIEHRRETGETCINYRDNDEHYEFTCFVSDECHNKFVQRFRAKLALKADNAVIDQSSAIQHSDAMKFDDQSQCFATRHSDAMICDDCNTEWNGNDCNRPQCNDTNKEWPTDSGLYAVSVSNVYVTSYTTYGIFNSIIKEWTIYNALRLKFEPLTVGSIIGYTAIPKNTC